MYPSYPPGSVPLPYVVVPPTGPYPADQSDNAAHPPPGFVAQPQPGYAIQPPYPPGPYPGYPLPPSGYPSGPPVGYPLGEVGGFPAPQPGFRDQQAYGTQPAYTSQLPYPPGGR